MPLRTFGCAFGAAALTAVAFTLSMAQPAALGRPVQVQRGWDYLQRLKHSPQVPRPRHALADAEQQDSFKKK